MKNMQIILAGLLVLALGACSGKSNKSVGIEKEIPAVGKETDGVFKGTWMYRECPMIEDYQQISEPYCMSLQINLYAKTIDNNGEMTYGGFYINNGFHEGGGDITAVRLNGNEARIEYVDPAGLTYSATLTYIPETQQLRFQDGDIVKKGSEDEEVDSSLQGEFHRAIPAERLLEAVRDKKPHPLSARKGWGLYGNVRKITDGKGHVMEFDEIGNILTTTSKGLYTEIYTYDTQCTKYTIGGFGPYVITYTNHQRTDLSENESDMEGSVEYYFDNRDRIGKRVKHQKMILITETFTYSEKNKLPESMKVSEYDESGKYLTTEVYEYLEVDKQGNWLKRKTTRTMDITEYGENDNETTSSRTDPPYIETRTLEYF